MIIVSGQEASLKREHASSNAHNDMSSPSTSTGMSNHFTSVPHPQGVQVEQRPIIPGIGNSTLAAPPPAYEESQSQIGSISPVHTSPVPIMRKEDGYQHKTHSWNDYPSMGRSSSGSGLCTLYTVLSRFHKGRQA
ncbi:hypothetical protein CC2G_001670 [Coprinopsis cinerea AmutBmut pab1-1]|nr:hypothetical protein CC2G_001670 [Coprinopsis cinerea AmutBmut pab1-1]